MKVGIHFFIFIATAAFLLFAGCDEGSALAELTVSSPAFANDSVLGQIHTCVGSGESPVIFIENAPENTRQFALILEGPDAEGKPFTHWLVWGIPAFTGYVRDGLPRGTHLISPYRQGRSDNREVGYVPPCPPAGKTHRYTFIALALDDDAIEGLDRAVDRKTFDHLLRGHLLGKGTLAAIVKGK